MSVAVPVRNGPEHDDEAEWRLLMAGDALGFARQQILYRHGKQHERYKLGEKDWNRLDALFTEMFDVIMAAEVIEK